MIAWNSVDAIYAAVGLVLLVWVWLPIERRRTPKRLTFVTSGLALSFVCAGVGAMLPARSWPSRALFILNMLLLVGVFVLLFRGWNRHTGSES